MSITTNREIPNLAIHSVAVIAVLLWCIAFWGVWFVWLSQEVWGIPMGLGGALYPVIFWKPVVGGTIIAQTIMHFPLRRYPPTHAQAFGLLVALPALIATIGLVVLCPMDVQMSYLAYFRMYVL